VIMLTDPRLARLVTLLRAAMHPPAGAGRIALALIFGALCHTLFAAGVAAMIAAMFFGLSLGTVDWPMAALVNAALIAQFPLVHSALLTGPGGRLLARLIHGPHGKTLATTSYAIIASAQLLALFVLWTPSGIVWFRAEGALFWAMTTAYGASWLILLKASFDAGAEVQSGALGWMSLLARIPARISRHADHRAVPPDPPADLCSLCADAVDASGLDTRSAGAGGQLYRLLPAGTAPKGTPLCEPLWRPV
jgi:hypothetical protein